MRKSGVGEGRERAIDRALLCAAALSLIAGIAIGLSALVW